MAVEFLDSFDHYNTPDELVAKWTTANGCSLGPGRNGQGLIIGTSAMKSCQLQHDWFVGFAVNVQAATGFGPVEVLYGIYNVGTVMGTLSVDTDGSLSLWAGNGFNPNPMTGNLIGTSLNADPPFYIQPNRWYYFEVGWIIGNGTNANIQATLKINGVTIIPLASAASGVNAEFDLIVSNSGANVHQWFNLDIFGNVVLDDLVIMDNVGMYNSGFLGDVKIGVLFPASDILTQWTGLIPGNQFSQINANPPVGDASYLYATSPPMAPSSQVDNFNWQQAPSTINEIFCVQYLIYARKDDEGSREVQQFNQSAGNKNPGGLSPIWSLGDSYLYYYFDMDVDPTTQVPWTLAGFNASQFGFQLVG